MANVIVQKMVVHGAQDASRILPGHVALVGEGGGALLGELPRLGGDATTVASVREAHNALVGALVAAGLATCAEGE